MPTAERHGTTTRGFLFADLRGYTAFVERHGAHRAAAMLDRYRTLVRAAVAEFDGAEIRTEGDSFYVVFDSASSAIECGLAIVARAAEAAAEDPSTAFQVGVGVHAGETVETAEGYVGSAVNTAARICAQAGPNQVLVSGTVRALTAGVVSAAFIPAGRRRLKGLRDPIELWQAVGEGTPQPRRAVFPTGRMPAIGWTAAAVAILVILAGLVLRPAIDGGGGAGSAPPSASASDPALAVSSTAPSGSVGASPSADAFPNRFEEELLRLIPDSDRDLCDRSPDSDVPVLDDVVIAGIPAQTFTERHPISTWGGIYCQLGGISAPDEVWYWRVGGREEAAEFLAQHAPKVGAEAGSCDHGPAVERWSLGSFSGRVLCHTTQTGDAVLYWTYDQSAILGKAIRDDMDVAALVDWWRSEARFLPD